MAITPTFPGVYLDLKTSSPAASTSLSTSGLGLVGQTLRGPTDVATLVTSWTEFERVFGTFDSDLRIPLSAWTFFQNGGQRLWVVRRVADDAAKASLDIVSAITGEASGITGDGSDTTHTMTTDHGYVKPGTFVLTYRPQSTVTDEDVGNGNGSTAIFSVTLAQIPLTTGSILIEWTSTTPKSQTIAAGATTATAGGDGLPSGTTINRTTGALTIDTTGAVPDNATDITVTYTYYGAAVTVTDDEAGALAGGATGTINYTTGAVSLTFTSAPGIGNAPTVAYTYRHFNLEMLYAGVYGNDYRVWLYGTPGYEDTDNGTFTRWTLVLQASDSDGVWSEVESFAALDLSDETSADFLTTLINDESIGSEYMVATTMAKGVPSGLSGTLVEDEVLDTGDGATSEYTFTLAEGSLYAGTLTLSTTRESDSSAMTVTDDESGGLIGDVLASGVNTVTYTSGAISLTFEADVEDGEDILATYYTAATYNSTSPYSVQMTSGADGADLTASDLVGTALATDKVGIYAFDKVAEMLMIAVPDFVGTKATDQLIIDWCKDREDRFALICPPAGSTTLEAKNYKKQLNRNTYVLGGGKAAVYYPWIWMKDPSTKRTVKVPPLAHVAGAIATTDTRRSPAKAPAGISDGALSQVYQLEVALEKADLGVLRAAQVNGLVNWANTQGPVVFGANTLEVGGEYGFIHLERMKQYIWLSIERILYGFVFEPNTSTTRTKIGAAVTTFMKALFQNGWFLGNKDSEAYQVVCDDTNNTTTTIAKGELHISVGFAPTTPAEFLVVSLSQIQQST